MTLKAASITGGAGLVTSAIQNSLAKQNIGAWGVFTRTGGGIAIFGEPAIDQDRTTQRVLRLSKRRPVEHMNSPGRRRQTSARRTTAIIPR